MDAQTGRDVAAYTPHFHVMRRTLHQCSNDNVVKWPDFFTSEFYWVCGKIPG